MTALVKVRHRTGNWKLVSLQQVGTQMTCRKSHSNTERTRDGRRDWDCGIARIVDWNRKPVMREAELQTGGKRRGEGA